MGKAITSLANHERMHAGAGTAAENAVQAAARQAVIAQEALFDSSGHKAAPAAAAAQTETATFTGASYGTVGAPVDSAAAAAFASHTAASAAANESLAAGDIKSMFDLSFSDPLSPLHASSAGTYTPNLGIDAASAQTFAEGLVQVLQAAGDSMLRGAEMMRTDLKKCDDLLLTYFAEERNKEQELGEAIKRRDLAIDRLQEANRDLGRRRRTASSLKPSDKEYERRSKESELAVQKAEATLAQRRDELERMTEVLKAEMARVNKTRRLTCSSRLAEHAKLQAEQAKAKADAWAALVAALSPSEEERDKARETVAALAKKAEKKARASSTNLSAPGAAGASTPAAAPTPAIADDSAAFAATSATDVQ
jgi:hypothetical protein